MRILVMGLPGSGKTTYARKLVEQLRTSGFTVEWINADEVRTKMNDWDFSAEGRLRQARRLRGIAEASECDYVVCDFVAALQQQRDIFSPNFLIWMDTIEKGRFDDTNAAFERPSSAGLRVTKW